MQATTNYDLIQISGIFQEPYAANKKCNPKYSHVSLKSDVQHFKLKRKIIFDGHCILSPNAASWELHSATAFTLAKAGLELKVILNSTLCNIWFYVSNIPWYETSLEHESGLYIYMCNKHYVVIPESVWWFHHVSSTVSQESCTWESFPTEAQGASCCWVFWRGTKRSVDRRWVLRWSSRLSFCCSPSPQAAWIGVQVGNNQTEVHHMMSVRLYWYEQSQDFMFVQMM